MEEKRNSAQSAEKTQPDKLTWKGFEKFLATEVIEQGKKNAKRWFIAWIVTLFALIGTNIYWIYVFNSYEYVEQYSDGVNSINSGTQGDIVNEPASEN